MVLAEGGQSSLTDPDFLSRQWGPPHRLGLTLLWEGAIRELERIGVSSPARLVDAALGTVSESPA